MRVVPATWFVDKYGVVVADMVEGDEVFKVDSPIGRVRLGVAIETRR